MFDEETERLAGEAGLEVAFPSAALRKRLDSKIVTTRLGDEAGVPSVPNVLGRAATYGELLTLAAARRHRHRPGRPDAVRRLGPDDLLHRLGGRLGRARAQIVGEELKVMKRINCREAAIEGVITRHGTLVGPLMTELTGYPGADAVRRRLVRQRRVRGGAVGGAPAPGTGLHAADGRAAPQEGYRGYFELDFLADMDTGDMWLGELNPRVTGASSMTNVTAVAYGDMPLFLFHLLEFLDVDYEIDVDELNAGWAQPSAIDEWSQFILKDTADVVELITEAPRSGIWKLDPGRTAASPSCAARPTGTRSEARTRRSTSGSRRRAATAIRAPTSASS